MKTNKYALFEIYLLSRSLSLGLLFSYSFFLVGTNALISFIFGILLGISFTFIYSKIKLNKKTKLFEILLYLFFILLKAKYNKNPYTQTEIIAWPDGNEYPP